MLERPVILTGFMGTGKSSVGRVLAESLDCPFIDLDAEIVAEAGKSINEIFAAEGESSFRSRESACLQRVLGCGMAVIATGGGAVIAESNRRQMLEAGYVVNLNASLPVIIARLDGASDRPLFAGKDAADRVQTLLEERQQFYAAADIRIDTDNKSVEDVAAKILRVLKGLPL